MKTIATIVLAVLLGTAHAWGGSIGESIEVRIMTDEGRTLPTYPVKTRRAMKKVYAEAVKGDHYRIEVRNRLNRRVGLVIAVDGRNIISGEKSWLKSSERMYILEPYGYGEFAGWRTGQDRINRFYFTDVPDSYAAAFGDESAMGVITVAAYPEARRYIAPKPIAQSTPYMERGYDVFGYESANRPTPKPSASAASAAPAARSEKKAARAELASESAGTGYGSEEYSPVETVAFDPESRATETIHIKYEWRRTLCRLGITRCEAPLPPANRLWDNGGYAPPPPGRS